MSVESDRLRSFYQDLKSWPTGESELTALAEKIARLLGTPLAAVILGKGMSQVGLKAARVPASNHLTLTMLKEAIKKQIQSFGEDASQRRIQLSKSTFPWPSMGSIENLVFLPFETTHPDNAERQISEMGEGWLVAGGPSALGDKEEILMAAVAQRLSELSKTSQLEKSLQLRNQFLSIASHELKTPLTSIYGILQLQERMARLKHETPAMAASSKDQKRSYVKILLRQVERLNELIDGLLDVSRIQNGRFMVEPAEVDVAALLREVVQGRLQIIAHEAGVKLSVDAGESLKARVDPVRMEEVVTNLVMNAIRFSPEGGVVWIRLRPDANAFRLTIRDQGPNVPPEDRERLFQPFESAQRTSRLGGLGLGLYISRQIALMHGGNVSLIESVPGKGNVIEAYFPIRNVATRSA